MKKDIEFNKVFIKDIHKRYERNNFHDLRNKIKFHCRNLI